MQKDSEVGFKEDVYTKANNRCSGEQDQIRACICDLRPIASLHEYNSSILKQINGKGSTKKKAKK